MRILLLFVIGLAVAGVVAYVFLNQQQAMQKTATQGTTSAQDAADAYRANQEKMMKELNQ